MGHYWSLQGLESLVPSRLSSLDIATYRAANQANPDTNVSRVQAQTHLSDSDFFRVAMMTGINHIYNNPSTIIIPITASIIFLSVFSILTTIIPDWRSNATPETPLKSMT